MKNSWFYGRAAVPRTLIFRTVRMQDLILKTLTECLAEFRVQNQDIPVLANVLQLLMNIRCQQRTICDRIEGLCMLLRRFSYPCHYSEMISRFGRPAYMETAPLSFLGLTLLPYRTTSNKSNALNEFISVKVNIHI